MLVGGGGGWGEVKGCGVYKFANVCQNEFRELDTKSCALESQVARVARSVARPQTLGGGTCLQAMSRDVTPSSWKQSAATGVVVRKRSRMFTVRHSDSKERPNWWCTGINQLSSLQRDSAVTCREGGGRRPAEPRVERGCGKDGPRSPRELPRRETGRRGKG